MRIYLDQLVEEKKKEYGPGFLDWLLGDRPRQMISRSGEARLTRVERNKRSRRK